MTEKLDFMESVCITRGQFEASDINSRDFENPMPLRRRTGYELAEIYRAILKENPDAQIIYM